MPGIVQEPDDLLRPPRSWRRVFLLLLDRCDGDPVIRDAAVQSALLWSFLLVAQRLPFEWPAIEVIRAYLDVFLWIDVPWRLALALTLVLAFAGLLRRSWPHRLLALAVIVHVTQSETFAVELPRLAPLGALFEPGWITLQEWIFVVPIANFHAATGDAWGLTGLFAMAYFGVWTGALLLVVRHRLAPRAQAWLDRRRSGASRRPAS